jgi:anti-anti-sigma factor
MATDRRPALTMTREKNVVILTFTGPHLVDEEEIDVLADYLYGEAERASSARLVLDFAHVELMGTSAWGVLLGLLKRIRASGGRLALCNFTPNLRETLDVLRLHLVFDVYQTRQEALDSFPAGT